MPLATPVPPTDTPTAVPTVADVRIVKAYNSGKKEYVEITNHGNAPQDMSGWHVFGSKDRDDSSDDYYFPAGFALAPGASVRLHSGQDGVDAPPNDIYWTTRNVWNNDGETVYLWDSQGNQVHSYSY